MTAGKDVVRHAKGAAELAGSIMMNAEVTKPRVPINLFALGVGVATNVVPSHATKTIRPFSSVQLLRPTHSSPHAERDKNNAATITAAVRLAPPC